MQVLLIFSHTFWEDSKVNRALLGEAEKLEQVKIHNLNTTYKDGGIDVSQEVALLREAEKIVFQFPLFWFSTPSLMKEWQDRVLSYILYGSEPKLLANKQFQVITTIGGAKSSYDGHHGYSMNTLLSPIYHSFAYMECDNLAPHCIYSASLDNLDTKSYLACFS